ncbi:MAG: GNAT family N-acetyltransferase [Candidatus Obscuribacterales bacterium]|nr:GNAT family N-acetyltransferase [Candidatus Obscuribacterales bacterium]
MTEIRLLTEADLDQFWQLRLRALKEEPASFAASYEESAAMSQAQSKKYLESSTNAFVFGAFAPQLVGMIGFYRRQGLKINHKGVIWGMYTAPEFRGKGIGKSLMQSAIAQATGFGDLKELLLVVGGHNKSAHGFYSACGFKTYAIEPKALRVGEDYFDDECMSLKLSGA